MAPRLFVLDSHPTDGAPHLLDRAWTIARQKTVALHYVPASHRWDLLPITGLAGDMNAIREALTDEQWEQFQRPVAIELKAGECTFHHPLMVHGSFAKPLCSLPAGSRD